MPSFCCLIFCPKSLRWPNLDKDFLLGCLPSFTRIPSRPRSNIAMNRNSCLLHDLSTSLLGVWKTGSTGWTLFFKVQSAWHNSFVDCYAVIHSFHIFVDYCFLLLVFSFSWISIWFNLDSVWRALCKMNCVFLARLAKKQIDFAYFYPPNQCGR